MEPETFLYILSIRLAIHSIRCVLDFTTVSDGGLPEKFTYFGVLFWMDHEMDGWIGVFVCSG